MGKFELRDTTVRIQQMLLESYKRNPKIALLTLKTGGGKTYAAIHTAAAFDPNQLLIVFTTSKVANSHQWEQSVKDYNEVMGTNLLIICYNYDKVISDSFVTEFGERILSINRRKMLILDEVHRIKLSSSGKLSQRSKFIQKLARTKDVDRTLGLSATPFSNSYLDLAPYLVMGGYYSSKTDFINKQIKWFDDYHNPVITDSYGNISRFAFRDPDLIDRQLREISVYLNTSQYMPDLTVSHEFFNISANTRYELDTIDDDYESGEIEFPIQARMMQEDVLATKGYVPKDLRLLNLLTRRDKGEFGQVHPILIFYQYNKVCEHLIKMIQTMRPDLPIHTVNGHSKDTLQKPHDNDSVYLVQYEAGGEGLDWQWSNMSVFYEAPVRYEKYVQAKGRNLRNRKLMEHVYHFEFEFRNTLDQDRWEINRKKKDFTDEVASSTYIKKHKRKARNK